MGRIVRLLLPRRRRRRPAYRTDPAVLARRGRVRSDIQRELRDAGWSSLD